MHVYIANTSKSSSGVDSVEAEYITIREAVTLCHASEKKLRDAIIAGELPYVLRENTAHRVGSWARPVKHIAVTDLERWLEKNPPSVRRERIWKGA